jgi:hypothetical protein
MQSFNMTPIEAARAKGLENRSPHTVEIRWAYFPHTGNKHRQYTKQRDHIVAQVRWLAVLATDELFRIKQAIIDGSVPDFFSGIVDEIYKAKQQGKHVVELSIGDNVNKMPLFEYISESSWDNPGIPRNYTTKSGPVEVFLPKAKIAPKAPFTQITPEVARILSQAKKGK